MVKMIPASPRKNANRSERTVFNALEGIHGADDWVVLHSLSLGQNLDRLEGEADFIVLAPEHGILIIEVKDAKAVRYKDGEWYLEKNPSPTKDPIRQLNGARRTLRGFLKERSQLGAEPIATMLWFPNLARHDLDNQSPGDMQFFEWQLAWSSDVSQPKAVIEKTLANFIEHFRKNKGIDLNPDGLSPQRAKLLTKSLVSDFEGYASPAAETIRRKKQEQELLDEQILLLDMVETNRHIYFDGPPGSGKTHLLVESAKRLARAGNKVLVVCYNLLLAEELDTAVGALDTVDVYGWNELQLRLAGENENPADSAADWYDKELPANAVVGARERSTNLGYDALLIDEFQDIASNPTHLELLPLLSKSDPEDTTVILCGDSRQQIMRARGERVEPLPTARNIFPSLVHVRLRRNCRMAPVLAKKAAAALRIGDRFITHRAPLNTEGGLEIVALEPGAETKALAKAIRGLLEHHLPENIVVLSLFGLKKSLAAELTRADGSGEDSADRRWLQKQLAPAGGRRAATSTPTGQIQWHSIFKYKGLDAEAVVLTDLSVEGIDFAQTAELDLDDTLFVGMTRARYRCVVLDSAQYLANLTQLNQ